MAVKDQGRLRCCGRDGSALDLGKVENWRLDRRPLQKNAWHGFGGTERIVGTSTVWAFLLFFFFLLSLLHFNLKKLHMQVREKAIRVSTVRLAIKDVIDFCSPPLSSKGIVCPCFPDSASPSFSQSLKPFVHAQCSQFTVMGDSPDAAVRFPAAVSKRVPSSQNASPCPFPAGRRPQGHAGSCPPSGPWQKGIMCLHLQNRRRHFVPGTCGFGAVLPSRDSAVVCGWFVGDPFVELASRRRDAKTVPELSCF